VYYLKKRCICFRKWPKNPIFGIKAVLEAIILEAMALRTGYLTKLDGAVHFHSSELSNSAYQAFKQGKNGAKMGKNPILRKNRGSGRTMGGRTGLGSLYKSKLD